MKTTTIANLRIIWAISLKDLTDSIKNKHVLAVILPAIFLIIIYRFIPMMSSGDDPVRLRVYSDGNESAIIALEDESIYRLVNFDSEEDLLYGLTNEELPEIALVFPAGFDEAIAAGSQVSIQGYMLGFFSEDEILTTKGLTEAELTDVLGTMVQIDVDTIPLQVESYGATILTSLALTFSLVMVGIVALPHMMLEEKDSGTLDVMLVSPAGSTQIVLAKSLTGVLITLSVFAIALFFYRMYFVHWWLIILTGILGAAFAISIGVGLGILVDSRQKLTLYGWIVLMPLFFPLILVVMEDLIPAVYIQILQWVPSVAIMRMIRTAMVEAIHAPYFVPQALVLVASTGLILWIDTWLLGRMDR